jgi:hypothetical protein
MPIPREFDQDLPGLEAGFGFGEFAHANVQMLLRDRSIDGTVERDHELVPPRGNLLRTATTPLRDLAVTSHHTKGGQG